MTTRARYGPPGPGTRQAARAMQCCRSRMAAAARGLSSAMAAADPAFVRAPACPHASFVTRANNGSSASGACPGRRQYFPPHFARQTQSAGRTAVRELDLVPSSSAAWTTSARPSANDHSSSGRGRSSGELLPPSLMARASTLCIWSLPARAWMLKPALADETRRSFVFAPSSCRTQAGIHPPGHVAGNELVVCKCRQLGRKAACHLDRYLYRGVIAGGKIYSPAIMTAAAVLPLPRQSQRRRNEGPHALCPANFLT